MEKLWYRVRLFFNPLIIIEDNLNPEIQKLQDQITKLEAECDYLRSYLDRKVNRKMYRIAKKELSPFYYKPSEKN